MDVSEFLPTAVSWGNVAIAVITLVGGWILSRLARRGVLAVARRATGLSENVVVIAARAAGYSVLLLAFGIALACLGANVQPLLAVVVIVGVVLVLVVRGISDNFTSGVVIQARQTIKLGDEIQVDGPDGPLVGVVFEMNARSVLLATPDGREVHVPNARLLADVIVNNSNRGARLSEVHVSVERGERSIDDLLRVLEKTSAGCDEVHAHPEPQALVETVSPTQVAVLLRFWHDPDQLVAARAAVVMASATAVEAAGWRGVTASSATPPSPHKS